MNVLSLFDGMSCGRIALERAGIKVDNYYASEVDSHAIKVTQANWPETVQLGDVQHINYQMLPKIDLIIGGSPCQGFSFAGKQLNFSDPRSALFFEFVHAVRTLKPKYFMLENVKMKKEHLQVITEQLGVEPILINSALVSAQNRQRYYWTNIPGVTQPEDKGILLADILQSGDQLTSSLMSEGWFKWWDEKSMFQLGKKHSSLDAEKAICMTARQYASWNGNYVTLDLEKYFAETTEPLVFMARNKKRIHITKDCLANRSFLDCVIDKHYIIRALTPVECERLQTAPDNYTHHVSNTQRYRMLGNGWTVDVIAHIFRGLL